MISTFTTTTRLHTNNRNSPACMCYFRLLSKLSDRGNIIWSTNDALSASITDYPTTITETQLVLSIMKFTNTNVHSQNTCTQLKYSWTWKLTLLYRQTYTRCVYTTAHHQCCLYDDCIVSWILVHSVFHTLVCTFCFLHQFLLNTYTVFGMCNLNHTLYMNYEAAFRKAFDVINIISESCVSQIVEVKKMKTKFSSYKIQVSPTFIVAPTCLPLSECNERHWLHNNQKCNFHGKKTPTNLKTHKPYMYIQKTLNYNTCTQHKYGWTWNLVIFLKHTQLQLKNITTESLTRTEKYLS